MICFAFFAFACFSLCFLALAFSFPLLCFFVVMYAIVFAPCSVNAGRQKQHHGQSIAERRQGERLRRACLACPFAVAIGAYCFIMRGHCLHGATPSPAGGTFSVRFDEGKGGNPSCSSPQPLVLTFQQYWRINQHPCSHKIIIHSHKSIVSCSYNKSAGMYNLTTLLFSASWLQAIKSQIGFKLVASLVQS